MKTAPAALALCSPLALTLWGPALAALGTIWFWEKLPPLSAVTEVSGVESNRTEMVSPGEKPEPLTKSIVKVDRFDQEDLRIGRRSAVLMLCE